MKLRKAGSKFFSFGITGEIRWCNRIDELAKTATHTPGMNILIFQRW